MTHLPITLRVLWLITVAIELSLFLYMTARRRHSVLPALYVYLILNLAQALLLYVAYSTSDYQSKITFVTAWASQAIVVAARWAVVCELCYSMLGQYRGVWALTSRALIVVGGIAVTVTLCVGGHDWFRIVGTLDLAFEFSIAAVLTAFFVFARIYRLEVLAALRATAVAFFLYSCVRALNDSVWQRYLDRYMETWNFVDGITFAATIILAALAVAKLDMRARRPVQMQPGYVYQQVIPQTNQRLKELNERLSVLFKPGAAKKIWPA